MHLTRVNKTFQYCDDIQMIRCSLYNKIQSVQFPLLLNQDAANPAQSEHLLHAQVLLDLGSYFTLYRELVFIKRVLLGSSV